MDALSGFPIIIDIPVQWGDMDALMHVNNVVYFRWWESSRLAYGERVGLIREGDVKKITTVLVKMECNFRHQLLYPDSVKIGARLKRIGNSSVDIEHRLLSLGQNKVAAEAISTVVTFDFEKQETVRIPDDIRQRMSELQPDATIEGLVNP
jgi:acyl-CoA thioester hydrolase